MLLARPGRPMPAASLPAPALWTGADAARAHVAAVTADARRDGACLAVTTQCTGGPFLTAFALLLGAGPTLIGLIAALPLLARLGQLYASWRVERAGHWRRAALVGAAVGRGAPLLLLPLALLPAGTLPDAVRTTLLLAVLLLGGLGTALFDVAWLTWVAELVPPSVRGVFFAARQRAAALAGLPAALLAAVAVDRWRQARGAAGPTAVAADGVALAYGVLFAAGATVGLLGLRWLARVPAPRRTVSRAAGPTLAEALTGPVRDRAFRPMLGFAAGWGLGMGVAAPFFAVFMLETLGLTLFEVMLTSAIMTGVTALVQRHWGRLADRFGTKTVLRAGTMLYVLTPLPWLVADPRNAWTLWVPLVVLHVLSGIATATVDLTMQPLVLKLAPAERRASYLASFTATYAAAQAVAPLAGGALVAALLGAGLDAPVAFGALFVTAALLRALAVPVLGLVHEPDGATVARMLRVVGRARAMRLAARLQPTGAHPVVRPDVAPARGADARATVAGASLARAAALGGTARREARRAARRVARRLPLEPALSATYAHLARVAELVATERAPRAPGA